ncbi:MAG: SH3 domain-containing protein [Lachnospiraceae bacterium]|nr:SH3 domain-containing protein [Lachnospiraceae bacterium]MDE6625490.1 SH3 domain-containing protein [Lachnospiraceae bacterium]
MNYLKKKMNFMLVISGILFLAMAQKAEAAGSGITKVTPGTVYSQYDLDEDGVSDAVKVVVTESSTTADAGRADADGAGTLRIYVNDVVVFEQTRNDYPYWSLQLITLKNGRTFIDIESTVGSDDDCMHELYRLKDGQLESICDFQKPYSKYGDYYNVTITKVSGDSLVLDASAQFFTTGITHWRMKYVYMICKCQARHESFDFGYIENSQKVQYKDMPVKNKWTAGKKLKAYKKAGSKKVVYTIKKGNTVKINRIIFRNNKIYFQIKNGKGKTGYIPCAKKHKQEFKEAVFAG